MARVVTIQGRGHQFGHTPENRPVYIYLNEWVNAHVTISIRAQGGTVIPRHHLPNVNKLIKDNPRKRKIVLPDMVKINVVLFNHNGYTHIVTFPPALVEASPDFSKGLLWYYQTKSRIYQLHEENSLETKLHNMPSFQEALDWIKMKRS